MANSFNFCQVGERKKDSDRIEDDNHDDRYDDNDDNNDDDEDEDEDNDEDDDDDNKRYLKIVARVHKVEKDNSCKGPLKRFEHLFRHSFQQFVE